MVMRIRICLEADPDLLVLQVNADSDPGLSWLKIEKNLLLIIFFICLLLKIHL